MDTTGSGALGIIAELNVETPMRDGTILRANVFRPDAPGRYPVLVRRTPYGKPEWGHARFVRAGYAVVVQDIRGRYASDGEYVPFGRDWSQEAEDGHDTVEWAATQPWSNGRVGTFGASYDGYLQWCLASHRPPSLVAMNARTIPVHQSMLDWAGGFRPARRVRWWVTNIAPDLRKRAGWPPPYTKEEARRVWDEQEGGKWLWCLPWADLPRHLPSPLRESAEAFLADPLTNCFDFTEAHREIEVPNLDLSGWYDHCGDTMRHLGLMQKHGRTETARAQSKLVIGPGNHIGPCDRRFGDIDFGPQAQVDVDQIVVRWFDRWLKNIDNGIDTEPPVRYFVMGASTWREADTWPPKDVREIVRYLSSDGTANAPDGAGVLIDIAPDGDVAPDRFTYDPTDPVPTLWTPDLFTMPPDRRAVENRRDICFYRSEPLEKELEVVGYPEVVLHAASSAPDTDFFARLVDEDPDGPALEVAYGMVRARHRNSLERAEPLEPGAVTEFHIAMHATANRFLAGHRIRLEITSSDYPNHDRNHNMGGDDASDPRMQTATQSVYHTSAYPSHLVLHTRDRNGEEGDTPCGS